MDGPSFLKGQLAQGIFNRNISLMRKCPQHPRLLVRYCLFYLLHTCTNLDKRKLLVIAVSDLSTVPLFSLLNRPSSVLISL